MSRASSDYNRAKLCQKTEHQIQDFSSALSELAAELRPAEMQSPVASAAVSALPLTELGSAASQSSALLLCTARLCSLSQLSSRAVPQLCCFSKLSSAAFHSSALLYLHSMVMLEACKAESWMIMQDIYILSLLTWLLMLMITLVATQICPQQLTM